MAQSVKMPTLVSSDYLQHFKGIINTVILRTVNIEYTILGVERFILSYYSAWKGL